MYISLYRKYRPQTFSDMVGQVAAVSVLQLSLEEGKLGHAYLFSGPRGCGKTSAARLVAKALNCLHPTSDGEPCGTCENCVAIALGEHLDVIEIDGASNRGIGEIRDLKSHVNLKPLSSAYKVYIIDEVHMLTETAFNALLKTLEEPPSNVVFLLATTEPHKVPVTIRSRCQHIPFHRISIDDMVSRVRYVAENESIAAEDEAVWELARQADGALRDALSLLEQAVALGNGALTLESVNNLMAGGSRSELEKWAVALRSDPAAAAAMLGEMLVRGISLERLTESFFAIFRDLWLYAAWGDRGALAIDVSGAELAFLKEESKNWQPDKLKAICSFLTRILPRTRYGMRQEVFGGMIMIELTNILEGKSPLPSAPRTQHRAEPQPVRSYQPAAPTIKAAPAMPEKKDAYVPWDDGFDDLVAEEKKEAQVPVQDAGQQVSTGFDFSEAFGETDFSKLLSNFGPKALAFGAGLLHASLNARDDNSWDLDFEKSPSFAESFLNVPQNKRVLSAAIHKTWGIGLPESEHAEKKVPEQAKTGQRVARPKRDDTAKAGGNEPKSDMGTMLKLMGAEVLYVQDKQNTDDGSEGHDE